MVNKIAILFWIILIGVVYHFIRDVLQIAGIENIIFTEIGSRNHLWRGSYCDYVTLPFDLFTITASIVALKRRSVGVLGIGVIASLFGFLIMWLWQ